MRMTSATTTADRDALVIEHVGLVKTLALRLAQRLPPQVDIGDLISVGTLGLIDAASRYKASTGVPFDAFARRRVHGAMLDALREMDWAPRSARRMRRTMDSTVATLRHSLQREPSEAEIAKALDLPETELQKALDQLKTLDLGVMRQLDSAGPDGAPLIELCVDPSEGVVSQLERADMRRLLAAAISELPERERQILALSYEEEMTLAEIGEVLGVCESRVSQLRTLAISRLRTSLRAALTTHPAGASRPSPGAAMPKAKAA